MKAQFESERQLMQSEILRGLDARIDGKIEQMKREMEETQENFRLNLQQIITAEIQRAMIQFQNYSAPNMPSFGNSQTLEDFHPTPLLVNHPILPTNTSVPLTLSMESPPPPQLSLPFIPPQLPTELNQTAYTPPHQPQFHNPNYFNPTSQPYPYVLVTTNQTPNSPNQTSTHLPPQSALQTSTMCLLPGYLEIAHQVFDIMLKGDQRSFRSDFNGYVEGGMIILTHEMFSNIPMEMELNNWNSIISGYQKSEFGFKVAWELNNWNSIISGYTKAEFGLKVAWELFKQSSNGRETEEEEIEIDVDDFSDDILFTLRKDFNNYFHKDQINHEKSGSCEIKLPNELGLSYSSIQLCKGNPISNQHSGIPNSSQLNC